MPENPWITFCISTYRRPELLKVQLTLLSAQTFPEFEVVISDNDPEASARDVVNDFDQRFRYFHNDENLGMIRSFNRSIERARTSHIVMVTDDDPIDKDFLKTLYPVWKEHPDHSFYGGVQRPGKDDDALEIIDKDSFFQELLDPSRTKTFLWSSCILRREDALKVGGIPDYGSPHLADHAFLVLAGSIGGGVLINHTYSKLSSHDSNFSKFNFDYYVRGCEGFYNALTISTHAGGISREKLEAVRMHLKVWFISNMFNLQKYYTVTRNEPAKVKEIRDCAESILQFPFMKYCRPKYRIKSVIFRIKKSLGLLK